MYKILKVGVRRLADGACIPEAADNSDWKRYQKWLLEGNTPQPADPDPAPVDQADLDNVQKQIKALALVVAQWNGKTTPQLKAAFRAAMDALP